MEVQFSALIHLKISNVNQLPMFDPVTFGWYIFAFVFPISFVNPSLKRKNYKCPLYSGRIMTLNCFYGMVVKKCKVLRLVSSWDDFQRFLPSQTLHTLQASFEPEQSLSWGIVERNCAVVTTTTWRYLSFFLIRLSVPSNFLHQILTAFLEC